MHFYRISIVHLQEEFDILVVGDDAVMNDDELVGLAGGVGVRVDSRGYTVSCPSGIQDESY